MPISDYTVQRDKFELETGIRGILGFAFPCNVCRHNFHQDNEEPCRTCDHNANAVQETGTWR